MNYQRAKVCSGRTATVADRPEAALRGTASPDAETGGTSFDVSLTIIQSQEAVGLQFHLGLSAICNASVLATLYAYPISISWFQADLRAETPVPIAPSSLRIQWGRKIPAAMSI